MNISIEANQEEVDFYQRVALPILKQSECQDYPKFLPGFEQQV